MKIVIQRVSEASVKVNNEITGEISKGLLLLVGVEEDDNQEDADWLAKKIIDLRIFSDEEGNESLSKRYKWRNTVCKPVYAACRLQKRKSPIFYKSRKTRKSCSSV